ncbi:MAG: hypothetical protein Q9224_006331 [Gallowayella concinna]
MPGIVVPAPGPHLNDNNKVFPPKPTIFIVPAPAPPRPPALLPSTPSHGPIQQANSSAPNHPRIQPPTQPETQTSFPVPSPSSPHAPILYDFTPPLTPSTFTPPVRKRKRKILTQQAALTSFRLEHLAEPPMLENEHDVTMSKVLD